MNKIACSSLLALSVAGFGLAGATAAHADNGSEVPDSYDDQYSMIQGTTLNIDAVGGLLANDVATGPSSLAVVESFGYDPTEVVVNPDGSFTYTPKPDFSGLATFQYKAGAGNWWGYARTVSIMVNAVPPVPVGQADLYSTPQDTTLTIPANGVLANDTGAIAVVDAKDLPAGLIPQIDGSFVYAPPAGFVGDVSWSYRLSDGSDTFSDWILVTISVTPVAQSIPTDTDLPTLAYTGIDDVTSWLFAPAAALLALGGLGVWVSRRRGVELS